MTELPQLEAEPVIAADLFGDRIDVARDFTAELARRGEELGLIGPIELPRLWTRHIVNCVLMAPLIPELPGGAFVADVGSGAGLPGLVLAIARPDARFVLIEPMERRVDWLQSESARLGLSNVRVVRARAEDATGLRKEFDCVTARAVSALRTLIPITAPLVVDGGELVFLKGAKVADELGAAAKAMSKYKVSSPEILELGEREGTEGTRVFRARVRA